MECIKCGGQASLDRVVVDKVTEAVVGSLCDLCQQNKICRSFEEDIWDDDQGCAVCREFANYHLPLIDYLVQYDDDREEEVEFSITGTTARLCADHLGELLEDDSVEPPAVTKAVTR